ncbi:hypothetical protein ABZ038_38810, partial [Streptomyces sp. NPDC006349]
MLTSSLRRRGVAPQRRPRTTRALSGTVCLLALAGTALSAAPADAAAPAPSADAAVPPAPVSWRADLSRTGADDVNV